MGDSPWLSVRRYRCELLLRFFLFFAVRMPGM